MTIKTEQLRSSWIVSATYDDEAEELSITTVRGSTYTCASKVPADVFVGLVGAASPGDFWHTSIKGIYT